MLDEDKWSRGKIITLVSDNGVCLGLPRVSRQFYQETALLPYKMAAFDFGTQFDAIFAMRKFLKNRSEAHILAISRVGFWERYGKRDDGRRQYANIAWPAVYWAEWLKIEYTGPQI